MKLINFISPERLKIFLTECKKIFAPISHTHKTSDVENLDENLNNKYDKTTVQKQGTVLASPSDKDGVASFRKLTKKDIDLGDVAQIIHLTKSEYDELEKNGQLNPEVDYITTDESDNITDSSVQLWNTLAQQGKYLSYSDQNGGKYLSLMNSNDNTAVAHAKLMDGESGEGMDVDADKVKTVDSKGILVEALGETTAQALIDEVAKRVIDLTGRMSTTETGLQSANDAITSLNSNFLNTPQISDIKAFCKSLSLKQTSCFLANGSTYTGDQPNSTQQWAYAPGIAIRRWDAVYILWFSGTRNLAIGTYNVNTDTLSWNVK